MRVQVLAPYPFDTSPGQRFRIEQWMPLLERQGVSFEFDAFISEQLQKVLYRPGQILTKARYILNDYLRRAVRAARVRRYDAIFLYREAAIIGPAFLERFAAATGVPVIYDFDDAIYVPYVSPSNKFLSYLKFPHKTAAICRLAHHVVVGNRVLSEYASKYNRQVTIVPTTIDVEKYRPGNPYRFQDLPVIGWSGSHSSAQYLQALKPAFERLAEQNKFRVEVIGADTFQMQSVPVRSVPWRAESELEDLSRIQIGVMPLPDESWARGKCALKALQYMALGIPTVASPVGVNREVIQHNVNGLLASTTEEWVKALSDLLTDEKLRRRLGEAGRKTVTDQYSAQVHAPRLLEILKGAARKERPN